MVRVRCGSRGCIGLGRVSRDAALLVIFCALSFISATTPTVVGRVKFSSKFSMREPDEMSAGPKEDSSNSPKSLSPKSIADGHCSPTKEKQGKSFFNFFLNVALTAGRIFERSAGKSGACQVERDTRDGG